MFVSLIIVYIILAEMSLIGGYSEFADRDEMADKVLTDNYVAVRGVKGLEEAKLDELLLNYKYAKQVVAGLNFKFHITWKDGKYEVVIWRKLDNTYVFTSGKKIE